LKKVTKNPLFYPKKLGKKICWAIATFPQGTSNPIVPSAKTFFVKKLGKNFTRLTALNQRVTTDNLKPHKGTSKMLVSIKDVAFGYNDKILLENLNLEIHEGDRIGLVGANGEGKTTLLNLIIGALECDQGEIYRKNGLVFGYMKQNQGLDSSLTVYEEMRTVFHKLISAENNMRKLEQELALFDNHESREYKAKISEYDRANAVFTAGDGYNIDVRIKTVLNGMGFFGRYDESIATMSGGEKTRLMLCRLLLISPELLILDEPTNHLDLKTLFWLEKYLEDYKGAIITVSHDRYFLDKTVTKMWDLENKCVTAYPGNYTKYKTLKKADLEYRKKEYEKQQKQVASMLDYAQRNIARATTSNSAKSRLHQLENMEILDKPFEDRRQPHFRFTFSKEPVKEVLAVRNLSLGFDERTLFSNAEFTVMRGNKVALIGANGTGKSTLVRYLVSGKGEKTGKVTFGKHVVVAYYDQENLNLNSNKTVIEELWERNHKLSQTEIRSTLASMLLYAEDMEKRVSMLSGGERAKLAFAVLMMEKGNFLILDEPTNHLDLVAREALEEALREYEGTVLFVSHDRYFVNSLATDVMEIENCVVNCFKGSYDEYCVLKNQIEEEKRIEAEKAEAERVKAQAKEKENKNFRSAKDRAKEVSRKQRVAFLEKEIERLEAEKGELNTKMLDSKVQSDYNRLREVSERLCQIDEEIEKHMEEWTEIAE